MKTDIEIAREAKIQPIKDIADKFQIPSENLEYYGKYKAKMPLHLLNEEKINKAKLILVSAITPTPSGEGKTTVTIGLTQALNKIGKKSIAALREPSLGPVFGVKGGAAGGGYSQVIPMEDINLHFTGDIAAVEKANNLLAALIDNHLQQGNKLNIDPRQILWKRVMDMNERALRNIIIGLGGKKEGVPRQTGFNITAASEVMSILTLSNNLADLKPKLANILVGFTYDNQPVYARDLKAQGAMAALLKEAIMPNLVQTLEGTPAIIHGGPFANIAQGTNSIIATKMAMSFADYVVTEAGFSTELGAEKFFNIKCRYGNLKPNAVVIVATIKAIKYLGGAPLKTLKTENLDALAKGFENLDKHIENIQTFGFNPIVAINRFDTDTNHEIEMLQKHCNNKGVACILTDVFLKGGEGAIELAKNVVEAADKCQDCFRFLYDVNDTIENKISTIAQRMYGAAKVEYSPEASATIEQLKAIGLNNLPICIAKTQKSLSDDPSKKGRPKDFTVKIREVEIAAGSGFIIPIAGEIMRMPGLGATPAAENIDIDNEGNIVGLF